MAILTAASSRREERWTFKEFTLTSGNKAFQGGMIMLNPATSKCVSGANVAAAGLIFLGYATGDVDATAADKAVNVCFIDELVLTWFDNGTGADLIASTDVGSYAYALDDHTASIVSAGHTVIGRIWKVDPLYGVAIEKRRNT